MMELVIGLFVFLFLVMFFSRITGWVLRILLTVVLVPLMLLFGAGLAVLPFLALPFGFLIAQSRGRRGE